MLQASFPMSFFFTFSLNIGATIMVVIKLGPEGISLCEKQNWMIFINAGHAENRYTKMYDGNCW